MGRTKCAANSESLTLKATGKGGRAGVRGSAIQPAPQRTGFEGRLEAPWRKTVTSFKMPCTLVHTTSKRTQNPPAKLAVPNEREKGRQIFWSKSLEGLRAMVPLQMADKFTPEHNIHVPQRLELPPKLEVMAPAMSEEAAAATFCSALHTFDIVGKEVSGQQATRKQIEENPFEALKFGQPFVQIPPITDQDITSQERRVLDARKRLQELRKSFIVR